MDFEAYEWHIWNALGFQSPRTTHLECSWISKSTNGAFRILLDFEAYERHIWIGTLAAYQRHIGIHQNITAYERYVSIPRDFECHYRLRILGTLGSLKDVYSIIYKASNTDTDFLLRCQTTVAYSIFFFTAKTYTEQFSKPATNFLSRAQNNSLNTDGHGARTKNREFPLFFKLSTIRKCNFESFVSQFYKITTYGIFFECSEINYKDEPSLLCSEVDNVVFSSNHVKKEEERTNTCTGFSV